MTPREKELLQRLVDELDFCQQRFYSAIDDGDDRPGSWRALYRADFKRWERLLNAARRELIKPTPTPQRRGRNHGGKDRNGPAAPGRN